MVGSSQIIASIKILSQSVVRDIWLALFLAQNLQSLDLNFFNNFVKRQSHG